MNLLKGDYSSTIANVFYPGRFSAVLDTLACNATRNAELTLNVNLRFKELSPPMNRKHKILESQYSDPVKIVHWKPGEWKRWLDSFVKINHAFWNRKFFLINKSTKENPYFYIKRNGLHYAPNVECRLNININMGHHHNTIQVIKLDKDSPPFRSSYIEMTNRDIHVKKYKIKQVTAIHEFGHLIGLMHSSVGKPECPRDGDTNLHACYGNEKDGSIYSIMGQGSRLTKEHALPWLAGLYMTTTGNPYDLPDLQYVRDTSTYKNWDVSMRFMHPRILR